MTIALQYLSDLSRVRISLSDLPDGTVQVQRSLNPAATDAVWERGVVRGGRALPVSAGVAVLDDYEFHADTKNHYRVVPVDPPAGLLVPTSSDGASTPDAAALDIAGTVVLAWSGRLTNITAGVTQELVKKYAGGTPGQRSIRLYINSAGLPELGWSTDGETSGLSAVTSQSPLSASDGEMFALAVRLETNVSGNHTVTFYEGTDLPEDLADLSVLSFESLNGTTSIHIGTAPVEVKAGNGGLVREARIIDGNLAGTVVANPNFAAQAGGTASFADSAGRTWTVNGDAYLSGVELDSITPSLAGRVWLKSIRYPGLNQPVTAAEYGDVGHSDRSGAFAISGASLPLAVTDHAGGRDHPLMLVTRDQAAEDKLRVLLRLGGVIFVHVPASPPAGLDGNRLLPGSMYAVARGWSVRRAGGVSDVQLFNLPLQEVRKPSPDVVGTTLTVGQLIAEHDSIESVWAAYPSIRDMWDDIGDINDLVVI